LRRLHNNNNNNSGNNNCSNITFYKAHNVSTAKYEAPAVLSV